MTDSPDFAMPEQAPQAWMPPPAPRPGVIPLRPLGLGEILAGAVLTVRRYPALLLGSSAVVLVISQTVALLVMLPVIRDLQQFAGHQPSPREFAALAQRLTFSSVGASLLGVLGQVFLTGLVTVVVGRAVIGKPITFSEALAELRPRALRLLGLSITTTVAITIGALLCILPGVWVAVLFALAGPALVLERLGVGEALGRSRTLVRDAWWSTFGILLAAYGIVWVVGTVLSLAFAGISFQATFTGDLTALSVWSTVVSSIITVVVGMVSYPFTSAVTALVYIDRRIIVERLDVQLAQAAA